MRCRRRALAESSPPPPSLSLAAASGAAGARWYRGLARLELSDGAHKGLLAALEQPWEPILQAVETLHGRRVSSRMEGLGIARRGVGWNQPLQVVAHLSGGW
jgi:hypothetical protein